MNKIQNHYKKHATIKDASVLVIESIKYHEVRVIVDDKFVEHIRQLRWCFEQSKGEVFAFDSATHIPSRVFKYMTDKIYLWKYITYLHTGSTDALWHKRHRLDLRVCIGKIDVPNTIP